MNILLVTPFQLSDTGGVCTAVRMLHREFCKQGHQTSILVPGTSNQVIPFDNEEKASVYSAYLRVPFVESAPIRGFIAFWVLLPYTLYALYRFTLCKRIDIVAIQYPLPWVFYFAVLRRLCPWKLIVTLQGNDVHDLSFLGWTERFFVKWLLMVSDRVLAVSQSLLNELQLTFPNTAINTCVVPNGAPLDLDAQCNPTELSDSVPQEYILTVGQLIHRKGLDVLIEALKIARDQGHVMNLVVVGEGQERPNLLQLAKETELSDNIYFVGNRSHEETLKFFKNCLFFVLASRAEGLPLVIVEAMASNKAVVATKIDGVPEIVQDGRTGLLVEPENAWSLAEALVRLSKDPDLRLMLACHGYELVLRKYSWEAIAAQYLSLFQELSDYKR